jgi:hypothetical protein
VGHNEKGDDGQYLLATLDRPLFVRTPAAWGQLILYAASLCKGGEAEERG